MTGMHGFPPADHESFWQKLSRLLFGTSPEAQKSAPTGKSDAKVKEIFPKSTPASAPQESTPHQIGKKPFWQIIDFLYLFHQRPTKPDIEKGQMASFKSLLSKNAEGLAKISPKSLEYGADFPAVASDFAHVKMRTPNQRLALVNTLYEHISKNLPEEKKGDAELKFDLLSLFLLSTDNPMLLSSTFEKALNDDADELIKSNKQEDRIAAEHLGVCAQVVGELRERIILQNVTEKQNKLLSDIENGSVHLPFQAKALQLVQKQEFKACALALKNLVEDLERTNEKRAAALITFQEKVDSLIRPNPGVSFNDTVKLLVLCAGTDRVFSQDFHQKLRKDLNIIDERKKCLFQARKLLKNNKSQQAFDLLAAHKMADAKWDLEKKCPDDGSKIAYLEAEIRKLNLLVKQAEPISVTLEKAITFYRH